MPEVPDALEALLAAYPQRVADLSLELRRLALAAAEGMTERISPGWRSINLHHPSAGYICGIFPHQEGVKVAFEHGHLLFDPAGLLSGDTRQVRYLALHRLDEELVNGFIDLLHQAVDIRV